MVSNRNALNFITIDCGVAALDIVINATIRFSAASTKKTIPSIFIIK